MKAADKPMNILWIGVDDLRPQLGCYGFKEMHTPNIDKLAKRGMVFNRAYVQQAVCAASRASLTTGCRPDTTGVNYPYSPWFNAEFRKKYPTVVDYFTANGYYTRTLGKIHHGPADYNTTEKHFNGEANYYVLPENIAKTKGKKPNWVHKIQPWEHAGRPDSDYFDGQVANEAIETIKRAAKSGKPFFIAPGFKKPHLPFVCPKKYYDLYSDADIKLSPNPKQGKNQPDFAVSHATGASKWWIYPKKGIDDKNARQLIHSYMACVSFIDAQVGKILDEVEVQGLQDNTAIMFWSDHGWHLGDHGMWGKSTNYEWSTRSPLIVSIPGMKESGKQTNALVEYVDMYPTLCDIVGIPKPEWLEGTSMVPLFSDADQQWKKAAFSQFPRGNKVEGFTVRTKDYRYTEWRDMKTGKMTFQEFYDNRKNLLEAKNLASNPEYKQHLNEHKQILADGWKKCLPLGITNNTDMPRGDDSYYFLSKEKKKKAGSAYKKSSNRKK
jgi:iduronate 2-sulfatase